MMNSWYSIYGLDQYIKKILELPKLYSLPSKRDMYWLSGMIATYIIGHMLLIFFQSAILVNMINVTVLVPILFTSIPLLGIYLSIKGKLLEKTNKLRKAAIVMLILFSLTWLFFVYAYLKLVVLPFI